MCDVILPSLEESTLLTGLVGPEEITDYFFELGAKLNDPLEMYLNDLYTLPANIAGLPGLSIPGGFVDGLPVGLQIVGRPFSEPTLLRIANAYQTHTDWHNQAPDVSSY